MEETYYFVENEQGETMRIPESKLDKYREPLTKPEPKLNWQELERLTQSLRGLSSLQPGKQD